MVMVDFNLACELWKMAEMFGNTSLAIVSCASLLESSVQDWTISPTVVAAAFRASWRLVKRLVAFGSSWCRTNGMVIHLVNALPLLLVNRQLADTRGRVEKLSML